jgi:TUP1-like enhancer of split
VEYKQILLVYAEKIADEGFKNKAEELIKDLFGPIYWFVPFRAPVVRLWLEIQATWHE